MNETTKNDIQRLIYENRIEPQEVFQQFISILDDIDRSYVDRATVRTRNEKNKVLTSLGTNYFTFVERGTRPKPDTIFAGALEKGPRSNKTPVVRVRSNNQHLPKITSLFKFPFGKERNPDWTNIIISTATIGTLKELLNSEVLDYFKTSKDTHNAIR